MSVPSSDSAGIRQIIRALRADGWVLDSVFDGEEDVDVSTEQDAVEAITAVEDAYLHVKEGTLASSATGWVRFVLGNDPEEVACDWTVNLATIDRVTSSWWD